MRCNCKIEATIQQPWLCAVSGAQDAAVHSICPTCSSLACEVWGAALHWSSRDLRAALITAQMRRLRELAALCKTLPTDIIYADLNELRLNYVWQLRAARLWIDLLAGPKYQPVCSKIRGCSFKASGCRDWVTGLRHQPTSVGYIFYVDAPALPVIDLVYLRSKTRLVAHAPWQESPRLAPYVGSQLCTYLRWFASHHPITMLPVIQG